MRYMATVNGNSMGVFFLGPSVEGLPGIKFISGLRLYILSSKLSQGPSTNIVSLGKGTFAFLSKNLESCYTAKLSILDV